MPLRTFLILLGLFAVAMALTAIAGACDIPLYFGRGFEPFSAWIILALIGIALVLTLFFQTIGVAICGLIAVMMLSPVVRGLLFGLSNPGMLQYLIIAALAATSIYGWAQRDYLED